MCRDASPHMLLSLLYRFSCSCTYQRAVTVSRSISYQYYNSLNFSPSLICHNWPRLWEGCGQLSTPEQRTRHQYKGQIYEILVCYCLQGIYPIVRNFGIKYGIIMKSDCCLFFRNMVCLLLIDHLPVIIFNYDQF